MKKHFYFTVIAFFIALPLQAQNQDIDFQYASWNRIQFRVQLPKNVYIMPETDQRLFLTNFYTQMQWLQRTVVGYTFNKTVEGTLGYAIFLNSTNIPERKVNFPVPEIRPQQDLFFRHTKNKVQYIHRFRAEQRFIKNADREMLLEGYRFAFRSRYQLMFLVALKQWQSNKAIRALFFTETFLQFQKNSISIFDQQRFMAALRFETQKHHIVVGLMNQFQQANVKNVFINRLNLMLQYTINIQAVKKD